ncbi:acetyltransferase [Marinicrinis sediminis]|uniref:Acetyltransferase n=1 Tax=Marinicrinis sediminis TaxID=1652465 RepID=A0ABW5R6C9_9BACL
MTNRKPGNQLQTGTTQQKVIGIIGTGGHAKIVTDIFQLVEPQTQLLFVSAHPEQAGAYFNPYRIYPDQAGELARLQAQCNKWHVAIGHIPTRRQKLAQLRRLSATITSAIHPSSICADSSTVGTGSTICASVVVGADTHLGEGTIANTACTLDHDGQIGSWVNIGPGCHLAGHVTVGEGSELGAGAIVIPHVKIGKGCIIGAGAVVIRDIPDDAVAVGVPAKIITKKRKSED